MRRISHTERILGRKITTLTPGEEKLQVNMQVVIYWGPSVERVPWWRSLRPMRVMEVLWSQRERGKG